MPLECTDDGRLILRQPINLPEVLDLLIIGGGPAGTAAAFRAKERGLSALVVDFDDILKRIRDYAKNKPILPGFGGGDKMKFPRGGKLVSLLSFEAIDKDDLHQLWKRFYVEQSIPAQIGVEITRLGPAEGGIRRVSGWNHLTRQDVSYLARHVVIAIGRGVPRRFDIPGNTEGMAYRLDDANAYVTEPACVIGGGTSAAEAVIAISNAKAKGGSSTSVYWSYRGKCMPKVSRALALAFFEAYVGHGNIHYYPESEPVAVLTGDDLRDYLAVRVDRKTLAGRPNETLQLEFPKSSCIACIGEDIPESLLASWGIRMVVGGAGQKKRMVVTPHLETEQANVYLIGDILSQAYWVTEDFGADPGSFEEIKHRGNIKAALLDGVYVAEVIAQRLSGKTEIQVQIDFVDEPAPSRSEVPKATVLIEPAGPPDEAIAPERRTEVGPAYLVRLLSGGVEENEYPLPAASTTTIGRRECDILFPEDSFLSDRHASITCGPDGILLRDDGSANGVYVRAPEGKYVDLSEHHLVRAGRQFLKFERHEGAWRMIHFDATGREIARHALAATTVVAGREAPDIILDAADLTLSRRHLALRALAKGPALKDLKSVNGTYIKLHGPQSLENGDQIRLGQQLLKLVVREPKSLVELTQTRAQRRAAAPPKAQEQPTASAPAVSFKGTGKVCTHAAGDTICAVAEANQIAITAECHAGICGSDPIRILSGGDHLNKMSEQERSTLEDICELDPVSCRLACMARSHGTVEVEILKP